MKKVNSFNHYEDILVNYIFYVILHMIYMYQVVEILIWYFIRLLRKNDLFKWENRKSRNLTHFCHPTVQHSIKIIIIATEVPVAIDNTNKAFTWHGFQFVHCYTCFLSPIYHSLVFCRHALHRIQGSG